MARRSPWMVEVAFAALAVALLVGVDTGRVESWIDTRDPLPVEAVADGAKVTVVFDKPVAAATAWLEQTRWRVETPVGDVAVAALAHERPSVVSLWVPDGLGSGDDARLAWNGSQEGTLQVQIETARGALPSARISAAAAVLGDALWIAGGHVRGGPSGDPFDVALDTIVRYDLATGSSRLVGRLPAPLYNAAAAVVPAGGPGCPDGCLILAGGDALRMGQAHQDAILRVEPGGHVEHIGDLPEAAAGISAAWTGDAVLLSGGSRPDALGGGRIDSVLRLDVRTGALEAAGNLPRGHSDHGSAWLASAGAPSCPGCLFVVGGVHDGLVASWERRYDVLRLDETAPVAIPGTGTYTGEAAGRAAVPTRAGTILSLGLPAYEYDPVLDRFDAWHGDWTPRRRAAVALADEVAWVIGGLALDPSGAEVPSRLIEPVPR